MNHFSYLFFLLSNSEGKAGSSEGAGRQLTTPPSHPLRTAWSPRDWRTLRGAAETSLPLRVSSHLAPLVTPSPGQRRRCTEGAGRARSRGAGGEKVGGGRRSGRGPASVEWGCTGALGPWGQEGWDSLQAKSQRQGFLSQFRSVVHFLGFSFLQSGGILVSPFPDSASCLNNQKLMGMSCLSRKKKISEYAPCKNIKRSDRLPLGSLPLLPPTHSDGFSFPWSSCCGCSVLRTWLESLGEPFLTQIRPAQDAFGAEKNLTGIFCWFHWWVSGQASWPSGSDNFLYLFINRSKVNQAWCPV